MHTNFCKSYPFAQGTLPTHTHAHISTHHPPISSRLYLKPNQKQAASESHCIGEMFIRTYPRLLDPALLEGAGLGIVGADVPVLTPVTVIWTTDTGQTPEREGQLRYG